MTATPPSRPQPQTRTEGDDNRLGYWYCERCRQSGSVTYNVHAGVWEVYSKLMEAHTAAKPTCKAANYEIRISGEPPNAATPPTADSGR